MNAGHPGWCEQGHHCNLNEHRSAPYLIDLPGLARGVVTRVGDGQRQYAEIRIRLALHPAEAVARRQLGSLLLGLRGLLTRAVQRGSV
jgi:hypothetical protein